MRVAKSVVANVFFVFFLLVSNADGSSLNLISNGGFENGLTDWNVEWGGGEQLGISQIDIDGYPGGGLSNAFSTRATSDDTTISQQISVIAGNSYHLSMNIGSHLAPPFGNESGGIFTVHIGDKRIAEFDFGFVAGEWTPISEHLFGGYTATESIDTLFSLSIYRPFERNNNTPIQYVDDISLTVIDIAAVPLPAGVWLFGSVVAGAGLMARRRKAKLAANA